MISGRELMLGDYVNIAEYDHPKVIGVVKEIYSNGKEVLIAVNNEQLTLTKEHIYELFLSKTFFLENGFKELQIYKSFTLLYNEVNNVVLKIMHSNRFQCEINGIKLEYVHEFQHLMRLRGLYIYAYNLKV